MGEKPTVLNTVAPDDPRVQAHYAENPGAAEHARQERERLNAELAQKPSAYSQWKREGARRAGQLVMPTRLVRERARNPRTVLVGRPDRLRLVPTQVLAAKAAPTNAPRRTNGTSGRPRASATRSSAASGDSGDSDPDPPSRPEGRAAFAWFHVALDRGRRA
jgi:hypothetical protein